MNKIVIWSGGILILLNVLIGLIVSTIGAVNIITTSIIIILTTVTLVWLNDHKRLKDGFKMSLNFIIPSIGFIEYLFALFMPNRFIDNWYLIITLILIALEVLLMISVTTISKQVE